MSQAARQLLEERYSWPSWFHRDDEPERLARSRQMLDEIATVPAWPSKRNETKEGDE